MFFRILMRDLKRKKTMNIILLLFVILAGIFMASGINNVLTVMGGTDYFLDKAGVGDVILIDLVKEGGKTIDDVCADMPEVQELRVEDAFAIADSNVSMKGKKPEKAGTILVQSVQNSGCHFFDEDNQEVTSIPKGHIFILEKFRSENKLDVGDKIKIKSGDVEKEFIIDGVVKDALFSPKLISIYHFLINEEEYNEFMEDAYTKETYFVQLANLDTDDIPAVVAKAGKIDGLLATLPKSTMKLAYMMDMLVPFMVLILSVCLMIVAFVVLKFTINFTITEEFREIGVMKAIGIRNFKIRSLYIVKYVVMAVIGSFIGFFISIPVGQKLMDASAKNMVLGNDAGSTLNLIGSLFVILIIIVLSYLCTKKIKKLTPIDAVRVGQTGERYKKKTPCRIGKSYLGNSMYLAVNDVLSNMKRYVTISISFLICTLFVLTLVNTTTTMRSPKLAGLFGAPSDMYVTVAGDYFDEIMQNGVKKQDIKKKLEENENALKEGGLNAKVFVAMYYNYNLTFKGNDYNQSFVQYIGRSTKDLEYLEGSAPQNEDEIAITHQVSDVTGAKLGDTVTIDFGEGKKDCIITAYFQTMDNAGQKVQLYEDAPIDSTHWAGFGFHQLIFDDNPTEEDLIARRNQVAKIFGIEKKDVRTVSEFCADTVAVTETMEMVQYLLLAITMVVVVLVTVLMERSFIADEKTQIAILKAIGFKDSSIIWWHVYRFGIVGLVSVLLAGVLSMPVTNLTITPIFAKMGAIGVDYKFDPLKMFVIYPGIVLGTTVLVAWVTALYTKTIKSSDTASIE